MNQLVLFHFQIQNNDKYFQFLAQPGSNFDEIEAALEQFQEEFKVLKAIALENEQKAKADAEAKAAESEGALDPEVLA